MTQAARSHQQNIVEGYNFKSTKSYIKLLGVSRGSGEELLLDYLDFARQRGVVVWQKNDRRLEGLRGGRKRRRERIEGQEGKEGRWRLPFDPSNPSDYSSPSII